MCLTLCMTLAGPTLAMARSGMAPLHPMPNGQGEGQEKEEPAEAKSPATALALSVGTTALGVAMLLSEQHEVVTSGGALLTLMGPYAGYAYTSESRRALAVASVQAGGATALLLGLSMSAPGGELFEPDDPDSPMLGGVLILAGATAFASASIYAIVDSYQSAQRSNQKHRELELSPSAVVGPMRSQGMGMALRGSF